MPRRSRIELNCSPSVRAAVAGVASGYVPLAAVILFALDLPLLARIAICICAATICIATIHSVFLLGGPDAIRALHWSETGQLYAVSGTGISASCP